MAKSKDTASPPEGPASDKPVAPIKPSPEKREALLTLEQLDPVAPDFIVIDKVTYDLANRDAWGLLERLRVKRLSGRLEELEALKTDPSPEEQAEYLQRLREVAQIALPGLPDDVLQSLQPGQLSDVWLSFLANQLTRGKGAALAMLLRGSRGIA